MNNVDMEFEAIEVEATKMTMEYSDGSVKEFPKGFIVVINEPKEGETESTVNISGCNLSGKELIQTVFVALSPLAQAFAQNMPDEDDDD